MTARRLFGARSWRGALVTLFALGALMLPATASADTVGVCVVGVVSPCNGNVLPAPYVHPWAGYKGWGVIKSYYCPPNTACPRIATQAYVTAWRWNGRWNQTWLANESQVYVYPYATGWSWVWTQGTGWLAVSDNYVYVRVLYR
jgi:hypothetical protein